MCTECDLGKVGEVGASSAGVHLVCDGVPDQESVFNTLYGVYNNNNVAGKRREHQGASLGKWHPFMLYQTPFDSHRWVASPVSIADCEMRRMSVRRCVADVDNGEVDDQVNMQLEHLHKQQPLSTTCLSISSEQPHSFNHAPFPL